jgi:hypothetical protein
MSNAIISIKDTLVCDVSPKSLQHTSFVQGIALAVLDVAHQFAIIEGLHRAFAAMRTVIGYIAMEILR